MNDSRLSPMTLEEAKQILAMEVDWDWEKFRREAAKDILAGFAANEGLGIKNYQASSCKYAVQLADELIKQLRED